MPDVLPRDEGCRAHQGGSNVGNTTEHAQEVERAPQPVLTATALQQVLPSDAGQPEALPRAASSSVCAPQPGKAAATAAHTFADCALPAAKEEVPCAMEADSAVHNDQLAVETPSNADAHHGIEPHSSFSKQSSDASSIPAAHVQLLQIAEHPREGVNPTPGPSTPAAVAAALAGPSDLMQQPIHLASPGAAGGPAAVSTAQAMALQRPSSEETDHMLVQALSQTDAVPSLTLLSPAEHAAVMEQTAAVELAADTASPQVAASDLSANSAPSLPVARAAEGTGLMANASQPIQASLQLCSLPLATPTKPPPELRSSETVAPLRPVVSESALLSDFASESLDTPVKPKRRSLMSRLRATKGSKGGSGLERTASNPALLMRQPSADLEKLKSPTKRLSLSALLRRGSSGDAIAAAVDPTAVASDGKAATAAEASTDVVGSLASLPSAVTTAGLDQMQSSSQAKDARPLLLRAISSGASSAQHQGLQPQSAPASPRGRGGTAPPKGNAVQPDLALGRAVSDPSMLARLSSGMPYVSSTPRRMSLLGRLSRGRRSNSIMPEPSSDPTPGQWESAQKATAEEVPFAEQPFAEQPLVEQPSGEPPLAKQPLAEQTSAEQPSAEQPSAKQPFAKQPLAKQPLAKQLVAEQPSVEQPPVKQPSAEQPFAEQPSAEQPFAKQHLAEQPSAEQPSAEQPLAATFLPKDAQSGQQLHAEQSLADLTEPQDVAGESETPPLHTHCCGISGQRTSAQCKAFAANSHSKGEKSAVW